MAQELSAWLPRFACPECGSPIDPPIGDRMSCARCAHVYERRGGVWRFLVPTRHARLAPFAQQYRIVREREGRRSQSGEYYRGLPTVARTDPHARDWQIRQETYGHLLRHVFAWGEQPSAVLDLGAGSAWLSHRLATLGHHVVAVDAIEDEADGLGAIRHYAAPIVAVHADFDAPPFVAGQFDVVIFNGSLHYAPDVGATLVRARRMLAPGGTLVVMDSPMFHADRDGAAMVEQSVERIATDCGLREVVQPGGGYLTFPSLAASADALQMASEFVPSRGPIGWRMCRQLARIRLGRQPAAFGLWVAR